MLAKNWLNFLFLPFPTSNPASVTIFGIKLNGLNTGKLFLSKSREPVQ